MRGIQKTSLFLTLLFLSGCPGLQNMMHALGQSLAIFLATARLETDFSQTQAKVEYQDGNIKVVSAPVLKLIVSGQIPEGGYYNISFEPDETKTLEAEEAELRAAVSLKGMTYFHSPDCSGEGSFTQISNVFPALEICQDENCTNKVAPEQRGGTIRRIVFSIPGESLIQYMVSFNAEGSFSLKPDLEISDALDESGELEAKLEQNTCIKVGVSSKTVVGNQ